MKKQPTLEVFYQKKQKQSQVPPSEPPKEEVKIEANEVVCYFFTCLSICFLM